MNIKMKGICKAFGLNQAMVITLATIKPLDEKLVLNPARKCGKTITYEEHSVNGGLGEAGGALPGEMCPIQIRRIGVNDCIDRSGPAKELWKLYGLTSAHIVKTAKKLFDFQDNSSRIGTAELRT